MRHCRCRQVFRWHNKSQARTPLLSECLKQERHSTIPTQTTWCAHTACPPNRAGPFLLTKLISALLPVGSETRSSTSAIAARAPLVGAKMVYLTSVWQKRSQKCWVVLVPTLYGSVYTCKAPVARPVEGLMLSPASTFQSQAVMTCSTG